MGKRTEQKDTKFDLCASFYILAELQTVQVSCTLLICTSGCHHDIENKELSPLFVCLGIKQFDYLGFDPITNTFQLVLILVDILVGHQGAGLPWSGENIWKMNFFPGQGKVREFCGWSGKFRKALESQGI